jgi:uncharacterized membrane protein YphA (DoxX/SURF4 family)
LNLLTADSNHPKRDRNLAAAPVDSQTGGKTLRTAQSKFTTYSTIYLRLALGAAYLSSVASRFGLWGQGDSWGNFHNFLVYTAKLNPFLPASLIPPVGWLATIAETVLAVLIVFGIRLRMASILSGILLLLFAIGMAIGFGVKEPLDYSVLTASAASLLLAASAPHNGFDDHETDAERS